MRPYLLVPLAACACTPAALKLEPAAIPRGQGAVMGRVQVFKGDSEVTSACYVQLTDDKKEAKAKVSLDRSGYVFTTLPTGPARLGIVNCIVWNGLLFDAQDLRFEVKGNGATTYFGHVRIRTADRDGELFLAAVGQGLATVPVTSVATAAAVSGTAGVVALADSPSAGPEQPVLVEDEPELAVRMYWGRYGKVPQVVTSLAGGGRFHLPAPRSKAVVHDGVISAQVPLTGLLLTWVGLARPDHHWLAVRVLRETWAPGEPSCGDVVLTLDGQQQRLPAPQRAAGDSLNSTMVKLDLTTLEAVSRAVRVELQACGLTRVLSPNALRAAGKVAEGYDSMLEDLPAKPRERKAVATPAATPADTAPGTPAEARAPSQPSGDDDKSP